MTRLPCGTDFEPLPCDSSLLLFPCGRREECQSTTTPVISTHSRGFTHFLISSLCLGRIELNRKDAACLRYVVQGCLSGLILNWGDNRW